MTSDTDFREALVKIGDQIQKNARFSERDIATFATLCGDWNPLHYDAEAAQHSPFGEKIASGAHTSALLMGLATSHFSRNTDGVPRQAVALSFNFAFKAPIYADEDIELQWVIQDREWNPKLRGWVAQAEGNARTQRSGAALVARAVLLVKSPD